MEFDRLILDGAIVLTLCGLGVVAVVVGDDRLCGVWVPELISAVHPSI
jgi:hypothetical protein